MNNPINWLEIATTDLERAKAFYSSVFKLQFEYIEMPDSKMYMFGEPGKEGSAGALIQSSSVKPGSDGTTIYFSCEDVSNELATIEKEGGKLLIPKTDIGEFGFFAQIIDTEGNRIGLHSNK
jgi:predicted enzyme related to lactoylglutathione lyase